LIGGPGRFLALLALSLAPSVARADGPAPMPARVDFVRPGCAPLPFDEPSFTSLLRIELQSDGVGRVSVVDASQPAARDPATPVADHALAVIRLEDACAANGAVGIAVDDAATDKSVRRTVELGAVPAQARARVLALATAELLRASWAELILPDAPPPRAPVPVEVRAATTERLKRVTGAADSPRGEHGPSPSSDVADSRARERLLVIVSPEARFFFRERLGLGGARIGPSIPLGSRTGLRLRLHGSAAYGNGTVNESGFSAWVVTSGAALTAGGRLGSAALELGPHAEVGWGWRRLDATDGAAGDAAMDGALATVSLVVSGRVHLGGAWWSIADVELGQAIATDVGGVDRTGGATAAARLGFALSP
jgi:hypothetical protein